jgi:hypothetical protein
MEHDHMIEAFATNGANHPLDIGSLPRRARCRQDFANAHVSHVFSEVIGKDRIAVAQEVARELGKGKCLAQLLSGPICGRVGGELQVWTTLATSLLARHSRVLFLAYDD